MEYDLMRVLLMRCCLVAVATFCFVLTAMAQDDAITTWPREVTIKDGVIVLYQPQPEKLEGNTLSGRAAVAIELESRDQPVFGAVWFNGELEIDRSERMAYVVQVDITNVRIPEADADKTDALAAVLERELPKLAIQISMDDLLATIEQVDARAEAAEQISTKPPQIIFSTTPAILVPLDGKPQFREAEGTGIERVINTPFTLLQDQASKTFYLYADEDVWYATKELEGPWAIAESVPSAIKNLAPPPPPVEDNAEDVEEESGESGPAPKIIVSTEATELIVIDGKPEFKPVEGTELLYVSNSESDLLMAIGGQQYYVLLAGRWYKSGDLDGPWSYTKGADLPTDFSEIPESSEANTVLYAVPGTKAADEAVLDAQIPQTAAVDPAKASLDVEYDGSPTFEDVDSTDLEYAINTPTPVIRAEGRYYAVDEGIWFVADKPTGKWLVAREVPDEIYTIPPESSLYHVTFVRIYKAEPDVVYVGYTPGYTNTYVYNTTVVYGTGYYYPGWYGPHYYPRHSTWGFHARYTPWSGWGFGFSYSSGPFTFYYGGGGWYRGGLWGPGPYYGYHRGYRHGYNHGYRHGFNHGYAAGYSAGRRHDNHNLYKSDRNRVRTQPARQVIAERPQARIANQRKNNVYADKAGNVYRDRGDGWDKRTKDGWQQEKFNSEKITANRPAKMPESKPQSLPEKRPTSLPSHSSSSRDLNRSRNNRMRGNQRNSNFRSSRSGGSGMRRR
ncbi:MAG: hypothetical protein ACJA09_002262 [Alcanivorax sp.]|jgi:hypothetical protein